MWKNVAERGRPQMTIWRRRIACRIIKATDTHSEHVILIAFSLLQWLQECTSMLHYNYIAGLFVISRRIENKTFSLSFFLNSQILRTVQLLIQNCNMRSVIHESYLLFGFQCYCAFLFLLSKTRRHVSRFSFNYIRQMVLLLLLIFNM
jgi:hypothetical protein